jgi:hypothetical protein
LALAVFKERTTATEAPQACRLPLQFWSPVVVAALVGMGTAIRVLHLGRMVDLARMVGTVVAEVPARVIGVAALLEVVPAVVGNQLEAICGILEAIMGVSFLIFLRAQAQTQ